MKEILAVGKTKIIYGIEGSPNLVEVFHKDKISKGDGAQIEDMPGKGELVRRASENIFILLQRKGIPTHYVGPFGEQSYIAKKTTMVPLEFVYREIGTGSHVKRNPSFPDGGKIEGPETEIFFKDNANNDPIVIENKKTGCFDLHIASKPISPETIIRTISLKDLGVTKENLEIMKSYTKLIFQILKEAWLEAGITLVDLKCEFGITEEGEIVVGDEFSADNARLWPGGNKAEMIDKDVFRKSKVMNSEVAKAIGKNYDLIARITDTFVNIP